MTWLSSCSDDEDPADDGDLVVNFSNLIEDGPVWNTLSTTVDIGDADIEKLEVYIDGTLITTVTEAPFEINWDSNTVSDGEHVVKVVVTDKSGNSASKEVSVTVKNILLSFDVAAGQLDEAEEEEDLDELGLVILSDEDGNVIASATYGNGDHVELRSATFNGESFTVTEGLINSDSYPIALWTYPQVERGAWKPYHEGPEQDYVGIAELSFTNALPNISYQFSSNGNSSGISSETAAFTHSSGLYKSPSKLLATRYDEAAEGYKYYLFPSITTGANAALNLGLVNQAMTKTTVDFPQGSDGHEVYLEAYAVAGDYTTERYRIASYSNQEGSLTIEHPGNAFPSYYSETYFNTDTYRFSSGRTNALYNVTPLQYTATLSISDGALKCTSTGNFDFLATDFYTDGEYTMVRWVFLLPKGTDQSVAFPQLSETLSEVISEYAGEEFDFNEYAPDLSQVPDEFSILEYEAVDGYAGLKSYIRTTGLQKLIDERGNYVEMQIRDGSGGRISSKAKSETRRARRTW